MEITQTVSKPSVTPVFTMPMEYKLFFYSGGDTTVKLEQTDNVNTFILPIAEEVGLIQVDPGNWVMNKVGSITVGVGEDQNSSVFTFGPNPASESLNIYMENHSGGDYTINVYNLAGVVVKTLSSDQLQVKLDINDLSAGSYFLRVSDGSHSFSRKFIKTD